MDKGTLTLLVEVTPQEIIDGIGPEVWCIESDDPDYSLCGQYLFGEGVPENTPGIVVCESCRVVRNS